MSPSYPYKYEINLDCRLTIHFPGDKKILLQFQEFDLGEDPKCKQHSLEIYDGDSSSSNTLVKLCGMKLPRPLTSSGNKLHLRFRSGDNLSGKRFRLIATKGKLFYLSA